MAEGDSIHRLARRLSTRLIDKRVSSSDFRVARYAETNLAGLTIIEILAVGKHLLWRMQDEGGNRVTLHTALRMSGSWRLHNGPAPLFNKEADDIRLVLKFEDGSNAVAVNMPVLDVLASSDEPRVVGHLGPDLCGEAFDIEEALRRFAHEEKRPVIEALLDQRNVSGIGNLWAVELCFLRGLFPWVPADAVDLKPALRLVRKMMRYSLLNEPGMVTTGNTRRGETHWVYGRYNRPCRRCSTPIAFRPGGSSSWDRETWWCPSCQPTPMGSEVPSLIYKSHTPSTRLPRQRGSC